MTQETQGRFTTSRRNSAADGMTRLDFSAAPSGSPKSAQLFHAYPMSIATLENTDILRMSAFFPSAPATASPARDQAVGVVSRPCCAGCFRVPARSPAHNQHQYSRRVKRPNLSVQETAPSRALGFDDGSTCVGCSSHELGEQHAALVPPPRVHLLRYQQVRAHRSRHDACHPPHSSPRKVDCAPSGPCP